MQNQMNENEDRKPVKCLSPLLFPATIFILGLILNSILPQEVQAHWKFFCNLLMFCFGLIGWAFATCFIRKKRLHYGGTEIQEDSQRDGHIVYILGILLLVAFAVLVKSAITEIGRAHV